MKIPVTLKHKPVIVSEDYEKLDGRYAARRKTDAKGLSLGLAQWDDRGKEISAKVWRHTGKKWSRQSEELPLHRVLDLAILICRAKQSFATYDAKQSVIDGVDLPEGTMKIEVCKNNPTIDKDIKQFKQALSNDDEYLGERLRRLSSILKELGC